MLRCEKMGGRVESANSLVAADKTFCFYMAESAEDVRRHAQIAGIPANTVTEIETDDRWQLGTSLAGPTW